MNEDGKNELQLHNGEGRSARVVVIVRVVRERRTLGDVAERVFGPWVDPDDARADLDLLRCLGGSDCDVGLDWLAVREAVVVAAYLEEDVDRRARRL